MKLSQAIMQLNCVNKLTTRWPQMYMQIIIYVYMYNVS